MGVRLHVHGTMQGHLPGLPWYMDLGCNQVLERCIAVVSKHDLEGTLWLLKNEVIQICSIAKVASAGHGACGSSCKDNLQISTPHGMSTVLPSCEDGAACSLHQALPS